uniref:Uncharacterized protein n=1 Tax=Lepeophtheirus salmonis TaxID=72036 RepID=A0A0K2T315_LEPSM
MFFLSLKNKVQRYPIESRYFLMESSRKWRNSIPCNFNKKKTKT